MNSSVEQSRRIEDEIEDYLTLSMITPTVLLEKAVREIKELKDALAQREIALSLGSYLDDEVIERLWAKAMNGDSTDVKIEAAITGSDNRSLRVYLPIYGYAEFARNESERPWRLVKMNEYLILER